MNNTYNTYETHNEVIKEVTCSGTGEACRCSTPTPPTEDRDWKVELVEKFNEDWPSTHSYTGGKMTDYIRDLIATAEARGKRIGVKMCIGVLDMIEADLEGKTEYGYHPGVIKNIRDIYLKSLT